MSKTSILYALFCLLVIALFTASTRSGFSPFAQGGQRSFVHTPGGPRHK